VRGNPNTRDFTWEPGRPYRLTIRRGTEGWAGLVDGTELRQLHAGGDRLLSPMVWSEVFARCDDPCASVRWSDFELLTMSGARTSPSAVRVNYQAHAEGGCGNTTVLSDGDGFLQITNAERLTPQGTRLPVA
jgi:hypothetical protein